MKMISTVCRQCAGTFTQPDDPGRRAEFCSNACRQKAYRARGGGRRPAAADTWVWMTAFLDQAAAKERVRRRSKARRGHEEGVPVGMPRWALPRDSDGEDEAKRREVLFLALARALHEGDDALWDLAEALGRRSGFC